MADPLADALPASVRRNLLADGLCSRLMDVFTGGPLLAGLAILVGASNLELGLLAALPLLAQAAQLPTLALLLRVQDRRATVLWSAGIARILLAAIAIVLWLRVEWLTPPMLILVLAVNALLVVTATTAWNWWMRDALPADRLGAFFGRRMRATTVAALAALLVAGLLLDAFVQGGHASLGYAVLFSLGAAWGFGGLVALAHIPHAPPPASMQDPGRRRRAVRLLLDALHRRETRGPLWSLALVSVAVSFALPFVAVYLLRTVFASTEYAFALVTGLSVVSQLGYIAGLRGWGHLSDRHGERGLLVVSLGLLLAIQAGWALSGWKLSGGGPGVLGQLSLADLGLLLWLAVLHFVSGYALGGVDLGGTNLMFKSAPAKEAQAHLAAIGLGKAAIAGVGTIAAGVLWEIVGRGPLFPSPVLGWSLSGFQLLALVGAGFTLVAIAVTLRVPEPKPTPVVEVARTMRREVGQMSSIAGIRGVIHAVSYTVEFLAGPFHTRRVRVKPKVEEPDRQT